VQTKDATQEDLLRSMTSDRTSTSKKAATAYGAMSVLQPKIDDGTLMVLSGQTEVATTATQGRAAEEAQSRMDTLLSGFY
jgi:ABC-type xylose transport system substrate-binding protein